MRQPLRVLVAAACALGGCDVVFGVSPPPETVCSADSECTDAAGGVCECGHCSYPETSCALSNRKWPATAPGVFGDACVPVPSQIDARVFHTCMTMSDGTAWCWGSNSDGQLGDAQPVSTASSFPVQIVDESGVPFRGIEEIRTSAAATCVRRSDKSVWCWGTNEHGELGAGLDPSSTRRSTVPVQVLGATGPLERVKSIAMGYNYACAVTETDEIRCWGWNTSGVLGESTATTSRRDRASFAITLGHVKRVAAGGEHACTISETSAGDREAYCWGAQGSGRLGNGDGATLEQPAPVRVLWEAMQPIPDLLDLAAGNRHTCGFKQPGRELYCWGPNEAGQLGTGDAENKLVATLVQHTLPVQIDALVAGHRHSCTTYGSETWCWGLGEEGELGTGAVESTPRATPVRAQLDKPIRSFVSGHSHNCSIGSDLLVRCWGTNGNGELGDGTVDARLSPTPIARDSYCPR